MKVWIVGQGGYDGWSLEKIFSSEEKAVALAAVLEEQISKSRRILDAEWNLRHYLYLKHLKVDDKYSFRLKFNEILDRLPQPIEFNHNAVCWVNEYEVED